MKKIHKMIVELTSTIKRFVELIIELKKFYDTGIKPFL